MDRDAASFHVDRERLSGRDRGDLRLDRPFHEGDHERAPRGPDLDLRVVLERPRHAARLGAGEHGSPGPRVEDVPFGDGVTLREIARSRARRMNDRVSILLQHRAGDGRSRRRRDAGALERARLRAV